MTDFAIVNGVDIDATCVFPHDGLCPECRQPISGVKTSQIVAMQSVSFLGPVQAVEAPVVTGPSFMPCGDDASGCFPRPRPSHDPR